MKRVFALAGVVVVLAIVGVIAFARWVKDDHIRDEAMLAGRAASSFPAADEDYFHDMDGGIALSPDAIKGRNTWMVWSGGNDRFWDVMTGKAFGVLDFLKLISSHDGLPASRDNRWSYLGLVNEPCFEKPTGPDPQRYNLWLDKRVPPSAACPADPFENETKYPGVRIAARGDGDDAGSYYGYATGVVGLRLFPNPGFDAEAKRKWDAEKYYRTTDDGMIRPYRVGMSCAFCHAGPSPINPPADPEHPAWKNLSGNVGAQYAWIDRIFDYNGPGDAKNIVWQIFHTWRPGTLDTSLVSSDNINNPRTMNAVYLLGPRLQNATQWGKETLGGGGVNNHQFNEYAQTQALSNLFDSPDTVWTPRVLKDGADSVGALGALNRVYINIGTDSEEWLTHFNAVVGGTPITLMDVATTRAHSAYFAATEAQTPDTALYFLASTGAHHLRDAPGGSHYLLADNDPRLTRGKIVFADTCARCHSSKHPDVPELKPAGCAGKDYLTCWNAYWNSTKQPAFKEAMRKIVLAKDFLTDNYLSNELRIPVTLLHTNACSPLATNAIAGNIWDNFSSQSYKDLPSVGTITWYDPFTGEPRQYQMPAGGRGYTRVPSLVSLWSTAPYLLNNSVGSFNGDPSVAGRMRAFDDGIEQMLWPSKRQHDALLGTKVPGTIDRTTVASNVTVEHAYLPDLLRDVYPGGIKLSALIPANTPVDLLANINLLPEEADPKLRLAHLQEVVALLTALPADLAALKSTATGPQAKQRRADLVTKMLAVSKCPDFVVNRGHYFGTGFVDPGSTDPIGEPALSDDDKRALIEFLKTF